MGVYITPEEAVTLADGAQVDAFGRLRASLNHQLTSITQVNDNAPLLTAESLTGTASITRRADEASSRLAVAAASDVAIRQSRRYFLYRAGQSMTIFMTFAGADAEANVVKRVGYFDDDNGIFLEVTDSDVAVVVRSNATGTPVDTRTTQANWNITSTPGGQTLDLAQGQILVLDFQWLGVGRVRIGFDIGGVVHWVHQSLHANILSTVYMSTASLPARYEVSQTGAGSGSMDAICSAVNREGGDTEPGIQSAVTTGINSGATATTTERSALAIRLNSSYPRGFVQMLGEHLAVLDPNSQVLYRVLLNPTLASALTFTTAGRIYDVSTTQVNVTAPGHVMACGYVGTGAGFSGGQAVQPELNVLGVAADVAGTSDVLVVSVQAASGTPDVDAGLRLLELF